METNAALNQEISPLLRREQNTNHVNVAKETRIDSVGETDSTTSVIVQLIFRFLTLFQLFLTRQLPQTCF